MGALIHPELPVLRRREAAPPQDGGAASEDDQGEAKSSEVNGGQTRAYGQGGDSSGTEKDQRQLR